MTDAWKTADINLSLQFDKLSALALMLVTTTLHKFWIHVSVGLLIVDKLAKERARISAVIVKNLIDVSIKTYPAY